MKKLKSILQSKYLFKILTVVMVVYSLCVTFLLPSKSVYSDDVTEIIGIITQYEIDGNKLKLTLNGKEKIIAYYYFKTENEMLEYFDKLELGMILKLNGKMDKPKNNNIPNGFNYRKYLKYQGINYFMVVSNFKIVQKNSSVFYWIKSKLIQRIDKIDDTGYLRTFILGDKSLLDDDVIKNYQNNGISHLFSISGMHVSFLVGMIMFVLDKVSYNNYYKYGIVILILLFYLLLTGISSSILRTVIMFIVFAINKVFNLKIKRIDLMLIVLIISVVINPFILQNMGFQFSYIISFTLVIFYKKMSKINNVLKRNAYVSIICFCVSFPICVYNFYEVNILSIILNIVMIPVVSFIVFPMTLLTFVFPFMFSVYKVIIVGLEYFNSTIGMINIFKIILIKPSLLVICFYYIVIYLSIWNSKFFAIFILMIIFHKCYVYFDGSFVLTVLDVGQGDSIFVKLPYNEGNLLIDTGGKVGINNNEKWKMSKKNFSLADNSIIPYLKSLGIDNLDYLIITHGDYDHMGESQNLIKNFKVHNVIFNKGEYNKLESNLIKLLIQKNIGFSKSGKTLIINKYIFSFLNQTIYDGEAENENSNIIYFNFKKYKFLLMGDATEINEQEIINKYNIEKISFLKVGHHGSKTSSSKKFIDAIKPNVSLISVGKNNRYRHPNIEVIDNLKQSNIFRTDEMGSIEIKIYDKCFIKSYSPY